MAIQLSTSVRNGMLTAIFSTGPNQDLDIYTDPVPASANNTATGTKLASMTGLSMAAASGGAMSKTGTWTDASADNTGIATYFRLTRTSYVIQGSVGLSGSGADMIVDSVSFTAGQSFNVITFTITTGNA